MADNVKCEHYEVIEKTACNDKHEYCWILGNKYIKINADENCNGCQWNKSEIKSE